jgi:hypothetical protein
VAALASITMMVVLLWLQITGGLDLGEVLTDFARKPKTSQSSVVSSSDLPVGQTIVLSGLPGWWGGLQSARVLRSRRLQAEGLTAILSGLQRTNFHSATAVGKPESPVSLPFRYPEYASRP